MANQGPEMIHSDKSESGKLSSQIVHSTLLPLAFLSVTFRDIRGSLNYAEYSRIYLIKSAVLGGSFEIPLISLVTSRTLEQHWVGVKEARENIFQK